MAVDLNRVIEQVSKEKGIDKSIVISAVEEMMHSAARRTFGAERNIESRFNPDLGEVELFEIKTVVDHAAASGSEVELEDAHAKYDPDAQVGDEILIKLDTATMGRIAAQAAKLAVPSRKHVVSIEANAARSRLHEPQNQPSQRALARSRLAHQPQGLARFDGE